jgi:hypothetical protein
MPSIRSCSTLVAITSSYDILDITSSYEVLDERRPVTLVMALRLGFASTI